MPKVRFILISNEKIVKSKKMWFEFQQLNGNSLLFVSRFYFFGELMNLHFFLFCISEFIREIGIFYAYNDRMYNFTWFMSLWGFSSIKNEHKIESESLSTFLCVTFCFYWFYSSSETHSSVKNRLFRSTFSSWINFKP